MAQATVKTLTQVEFDYIIVGGGTSGLVMAARLTEDKDCSVLVLEAGENHLEDPQIAIPALWPGLMGSELDWQFKTVSQKHFDGRSIKLPSGKLLGGSSGLNGQAFIAPSKSGIDAWGHLGYSQWNWDTLLPYYRRFYTLHLPDRRTRDHLGIDWVDAATTGMSGPIQASFAGVPEDPVGKAWIDTFKNLGFVTTADPFSGRSIGAYANAYACDPVNKTRSYSPSAYFVPASGRKNLTVVTGAQVNRVLFIEGSTPLVASEVLAIVDGKECHLKARKEIILAAGAIQTPKLLELSGIGNPSILARNGIETLYENPHVGENLQDHVLSGISLEAADGVPTGDSLIRQEPEAIQQAMEMYGAHKAGPLTAGGVASHAFMPIVEFLGPEGSELQKTLFDEHLGKGPEQDDEHVRVVRRILEDPGESSGALFLFAVQVDCHSNIEKFVEPSALKPGNFITIGANQCHAFSKGSTYISSKDPGAKPAIDPNYFSHPFDIELLARHFQFLERIAETQPLAGYLKPNGQRNHPTAYVKDLSAAKKYLREAGMSDWHVCGSCAMRPQERGGVVDGDLIVHGTSNLRIIDASVFPLIPRGNIMSTVYATAEKAADIVRSSRRNTIRLGEKQPVV